MSAQLVARSQPDGYTLFVTFGGVLTINPFLFKEMGFDPDKDFVPVTVLASAPYLMLVNPSAVPVQDRQGVHRLCKGSARQAELGVDQPRAAPTISPASCSAS